jgi:hypothetical protein
MLVGVFVLPSAWWIFTNYCMSNVLVISYILSVVIFGLSLENWVFNILEHEGCPLWCGSIHVAARS